MHIAVASHQPLPAKGYGGPQRVVLALVRGLAALGARVTLLAPPGTRVPEATVVSVPPRKFGDGAALAPYIPRAADLVHVHFPLPPPSPPAGPAGPRNLKGSGDAPPIQHFSLALSRAPPQQRQLRIQRPRSRR